MLRVSLNLRPHYYLLSSQFRDHFCFLFVVHFLLPLPGYFFSEAKIYFTQPLVEETVLEKQPATFTCKISKPTKDVIWLKDHQEIDDDDDNYMTSYEDVTCTLTIPETTVEDSGEFTVKIGDATSLAKLVVNGEY